MSPANRKTGKTGVLPKRGKAVALTYRNNIRVNTEDLAACQRSSGA